MSQKTQFRKLLPLLQTTIAIFFGGWGLWLRNSILNRPLWGSKGWHSTAVFHVWPWQFKFAAILNLPALLTASLFSLPIEHLFPGLPEWISTLPSIFFVLPLWYLLGFWIDTKQLRLEVGWAIFACLAVAALFGALLPLRFISLYVGFIPFGIALWAALGVAIAAFGGSGEKKDMSRVQP